MSRDSFHRLLQRYLSNRCTPEESQLIQHWYRLLDGEAKVEISSDNLHVVEESLWGKIHEKINQQTAQDNSVHISKYNGLKRVHRWLATASIIILIATCTTFVRYRITYYPVKPSFVSNSIPEDHVTYTKNGTSNPLFVTLPDESIVKLYPEAEIEYPKDFLKKREVKLIGDAFFTVEADPKNPFWVFHEGMITKVLGTEFKVNAPKGEIWGEVIVYTGKVDVFYNVGTRNLVKRVLSAPDRASITANQRAVLFPKSIEETVAEAPQPITKNTAMPSRETFQNTPLPELMDTLSKLYALEVTAEDELSEITFTGDISGIGLFKQLEIICTVTNTKYEVVGTSVRLKNKHEQDIKSHSY